MAIIIVRRLDEALVSRLKRRAADNNRSLESEVRNILERAAGDEMKEKVGVLRALAQRLRQQTKGRYQPPRFWLGQTGIAGIGLPDAVSSGCQRSG